jgi:hypothetical protein
MNMRLPTLACASLLLLPSAAVAQEMASGTYVQLTKLHRQDAFFRDRKQLTGLVCVVTDPGLTLNRPGFYGGPTRCSDGQDYYWYLAAFDVVAPEVAAMFGLTDAAAVAADSPWTVGSRVRIRAVSSADAYASSSSSLTGRTCTVKDMPLTATGAEWWAGSLLCDTGGEYYFYQVAVDPIDASQMVAVGVVGDGAAVGAAAASTAASTGGFRPGAAVKITHIANEDSLSARRDALVGHGCSVLDSALVPTGDGVYAGRLFCDDGQTYQFFKVGVAAQ